MHALDCTPGPSSGLLPAARIIAPRSRLSHARTTALAVPSQMRPSYSERPKRRRHSFHSSLRSPSPSLLRMSDASPTSYSQPATPLDSTHYPWSPIAHCDDFSNVDPTASPRNIGSQRTRFAAPAPHPLSTPSTQHVFADVQAPSALHSHASLEDATLAAVPTQTVHSYSQPLPATQAQFFGDSPIGDTPHLVFSSVYGDSPEQFTLSPAFHPLDEDPFLGMLGAAEQPQTPYQDFSYNSFTTPPLSQHFDQQTPLWSSETFSPTEALPRNALDSFAAAASFTVHSQLSSFDSPAPLDSLPTQSAPNSFDTADSFGAITFAHTQLVTCDPQILHSPWQESRPIPSAFDLMPPAESNLPLPPSALRCDDHVSLASSSPPSHYADEHGRLFPEAYSPEISPSSSHPHSAIVSPPTAESPVARLSFPLPAPCKPPSPVVPVLSPRKPTAALPSPSPSPRESPAPLPPPSSSRKRSVRLSRAESPADSARSALPDKAQCPECNTWVVRAKLKRHVMDVHSPKPLCPYCKKPGTRRHWQARHLLTCDAYKAVQAGKQ